MRKVVSTLLKLPKRIVEILSIGEPVPTLLPTYFGLGALIVGVFSYTSNGENVALILIPMFIISGLMILYGSILSPIRTNGFEQAKIIVSYGLSVMTVASWTRSVLIWGVDQHGVGSKYIPTTVWFWITGGCVFLLIGVWKRGLQ